MGAPKKAKPTSADKEAAARLRDIWSRELTKARAAGQGWTQESAGAAMGMTQGAVSQYLHGMIGLGLDATLKFAGFLGVPTSEIRNDFEAPVPDSTSHAGLSQVPGLDFEMVAAAAELVRQIVDIQNLAPDFRENVPLLRLAYQVVREESQSPTSATMLDLTKRLAARNREK